MCNLHCICFVTTNKKEKNRNNDRNLNNDENTYNKKNNKKEEEKCDEDGNLITACIQYSYQELLAMVIEGHGRYMKKDNDDISLEYKTDYYHGIVYNK